MNRRQVLTTGAAMAATIVAGCLSDDDGVEQGDGYGPEPDTVPDERSIDTDAYETQVFEGVEVPLAPIKDVYYWYQRQEARIVDARQTDQFEESRIVGAAFSKAPNGVDDDDPVEDWAKDEPIVTYCGCPHHLSGLRAASLIDDGYEEVYALDEGFQTWIDYGYPIEGSDVSSERVSYEIRGQSDPAYAGKMVWLEQLDADRAEAAPIADDGSYTLQLHYAGSIDSPFRVEAPDYATEGTLEELTSDTITV
ncbi:rhodanese-like domain-containing protein [Natronorubrum halophilum]|uniref:rhodanese-like domain-containing protein n=1 Tax=Natronorubrum halophilum TaxID=1702106 RepID=UPI0010C21188|nr:rhodanese-like domain-containing protein [Natronorubrum halophilum]